MTPKEKAVVRAIVKSLRTKDSGDMMALAMSYGVPLSTAQVRGEMEALLLEAMVQQADRG